MFYPIYIRNSDSMSRTVLSGVFRERFYCKILKDVEFHYINPTLQKVWLKTYECTSLVHMYYVQGLHYLCNHDFIQPKFSRAMVFFLANAYNVWFTFRDVKITELHILKVKKVKTLLVLQKPRYSTCNSKESVWEKRVCCCWLCPSREIIEVYAFRSSRY